MTRRATTDVAPAASSQDDIERTWLDAIRQGDVRAFELLFRSAGPKLIRFARLYVSEDDDAEDIVHAVFCWLWERRLTLPRPRSVRSYLLAAVRNRALNVVRSRRSDLAFRARVAQAAHADDGATSAPSPESELAARDIEHALRDALRQMPPRCRDVYVLLRDHGLTYHDVADALGIAPKTVEFHMSRALDMLRQRLAPWLDG
jgi:RNA polymerase sigma-70 factor (ECF subfamily)